MSTISFGNLCRPQELTELVQLGFASSKDDDVGGAGESKYTRRCKCRCTPFNFFSQAHDVDSRGFPGLRAYI